MLCACSTDGINDEVIAPVEGGEGVPMTLTAQVTRVAIGTGLETTWEANDALSVVTLDADNKVLTVDEFTTAEGGEVGLFAGKFTGDVANKIVVWYPALKAVEGGYASENGVLKNVATGSANVTIDLKGNAARQFQAKNFGFQEVFKKALVMSGDATVAENNISTVLNIRNSVLWCKLEKNLADGLNIKKVSVKSTGNDFAVAATTTLDATQGVVAVAERSDAAEISLGDDNYAGVLTGYNAVQGYIPVLLDKVAKGTVWTFVADGGDDLYAWSQEFHKNKQFTAGARVEIYCEPDHICTKNVVLLDDAATSCELANAPQVKYTATCTSDWLSVAEADGVATATMAAVTETGANTVARMASVTVNVGTESRTYNVYSAAGTKIGETVWARHNLAEAGTFNASQLELGHLYQWNSKVGWDSVLSPAPETFPTTPIMYDTSDAEWLASNDPCPAGWCVPDQATFKALVGWQDQYQEEEQWTAGVYNPVKNGQDKLFSYKWETWGRGMFCGNTDAASITQTDLKGNIFVPAGFGWNSARNQYLWICPLQTKDKYSVWGDVAGEAGRIVYGVDLSDIEPMKSYYAPAVCAFPVRCVVNPDQCVVK